MGIQKYWKGKEKKGYIFVVYNEESIYRLNVGVNDWSTVESELSNGILNQRFIGMPLRYIKKVELKEKNKEVKIKFGHDSEDTFVISDSILRKEIYDYLRNETPIVDAYDITPNLLSRIKKPLIAFCIVGTLLAYILYINNGLNLGYQYEAVGRQATGLILGLAHLGKTKILLIFCPLLLISFYAITRQWNKTDTSHVLVYN